MTAYYNEIDPRAAAWLRELIRAGHIAPGVVDERSVADVTADDLAGYTQCHFFAGIGVWSYALRRAGWPDDRQVWTGSCPCQPFSAAGKGLGTADERHLWPEFARLIGECRPATVFGEQVASKHGLAWLDLVAADLEGAGYACGAVDTCAAGFGAPHIRQRLYWVAEPTRQQHDRAWFGRQGRRAEHPDGRAASRVADAAGGGRREEQPNVRWCDAGTGAGQAGVSSGGINPRWMADSNGDGRGERQRDDQATRYRHTIAATCGDDRHKHRGPTHGHWRDADWLLCRDGKWRPVEPAFKQMVDGIAIVLGYLRSCGENEKVKEAINAAATSPYAGEVLREMRETASAEAVWLQVGGQIGFHAASILFSFLLERQGKLGSFIDSAKKGGAEECARVLRALRQDGATPCPSRRYEYSQQFRRQLEDFMSELPQTGSLEILESLNGFPLAHGSPARVGRLRGYGNAIVAPQAEAFVRAYMGIIGIPTRRDPLPLLAAGEG